ncbi:protein FAR1-RELATED SEQUENCE 4-like [Rhododendron vialii]|uniref:protein FAR1-RELATED SEQUENCE 4-like n=1 Tax=Rhododendron vialii TaxID=182163 RepID=UPI00265F4B65|nr:protein FAR1-RELATED SEQUENCE 4-like [Rhododendron vialii]
MTFDTSEEAYSYYSRYAKEKGFAVAKTTSRKGKDGKLKDVTIACSRAGKARVTSNPVKPRPQSKIDCQAHVTVVLHPNGKWRLNRVALVHNHDQSPGKARYLRSNRVLDEQVKRRLELNDKAGINLNQTYTSLQIVEIMWTTTKYAGNSMARMRRTTKLYANDERTG